MLPRPPTTTDVEVSIQKRMCLWGQDRGSHVVLVVHPREVVIHEGGPGVPVGARQENRCGCSWVTGVPNVQHTLRGEETNDTASSRGTRRGGLAVALVSSTLHEMCSTALACGRARYVEVARNIQPTGISTLLTGASTHARLSIHNLSCRLGGQTW